MNAVARPTENFKLHARFDGPIVMVGFGSIGKGALPLIERHIAFDREKFVVIAPDDSDRQLLDERLAKFGVIINNQDCSLIGHRLKAPPRA